MGAKSVDLKSFESITDQICQLSSKLLDANVLIVNDQCKPVCNASPHTFDEMHDSVFLNLKISQVIQTQQPASFDYGAETGQTDDAENHMFYFVGAPIFFSGTVIGAVAVYSWRRQLLTRLHNTHTAIGCVSEIASLISKTIELSLQSLHSHVPYSVPESSALVQPESCYVIASLSGQILFYSPSFSQFFPLNWYEQTHFIQSLHGFPVVTKANQKTCFLYSGIEHSNFWGMVFTFPYDKWPSDPNAQIYYFKSLRQSSAALDSRACSRQETLPLYASLSQMQVIIDRANYFAKSRLPALLCGNEDDGLNLLAHYIHATSIRNQDYFVTIDCSELPLLDQVDIVLGTPGSDIPSGLLWKANKGCVYFKNIEYMSLALQERIGSLLTGKLAPSNYNIYGRLDIFFLFSTTKNFEGLHERGYFDKKLFQILIENVIQIPSISLAEPHLSAMIDNMVRSYASKLNCPTFTISTEVKSLLTKNIHSLLDLQRCIEILMKEASQKTIHISDVPQFETLMLEGGRSRKREQQLEAIQILLKRHMKRSDIAKQLGISRATLYRRIEELQSRNP